MSDTPVTIRIQRVRFSLLKFTAIVPLREGRQVIAGLDSPSLAPRPPALLLPLPSDHGVHTTLDFDDRCGQELVPAEFQMVAVEQVLANDRKFPTIVRTPTETRV